MTVQNSPDLAVVAEDGAGGCGGVCVKGVAWTLCCTVWQYNTGPLHNLDGEREREAERG